MTPASAAVGAIAGLGLAGASVLLLRAAWRGRRPVAFSLLGWAALASGAVAWRLSARWDVATASALLAPSLLALAVVGAGAKVRRGRVSRAPRAEVELAEPKPGGARLDALVRTLVGGPLAGAAAFSLSAALASRAPADAATRLVFAFLLAPMLWAAGLVWATTDPSARRAGASLLVLAALGAAVVRS